ncbi:MAG: 4-vinyl reductase [Anaerolineae bacterium]|nr:4-vinyl reductase [Anaerolineae bacterium]
MVQVSSKAAHDPVADMKLVDAYMRWALEAAEEVIGKDGLAVVLRNAGLERFIDNYPPNVLETSGSITYGDYTALCVGILDFFGRPGKSMVMRIGRISARKGIEHQSGVFNLATVLAAKLLPASVQVKMGLSAMMSGFKVINEKAGQEFKGTIDDKGDKYHFVVETCPLCAGKQSESAIGWLMEANIEEACQQVFGKFFDVVEVECKAKGAPAGVWEVPKHPSEDGVNRSAR